MLLVPRAVVLVLVFVRCLSMGTGTPQLTPAAAISSSISHCFYAGQLGLDPAPWASVCPYPLFRLPEVSDSETAYACYFTAPSPAMIIKDQFGSNGAASPTTGIMLLRPGPIADGSCGRTNTKYVAFENYNGIFQPPTSKLVRNCWTGWWETQVAVCVVADLCQSYSVGSGVCAPQAIGSANLTLPPSAPWWNPKQCSKHKCLARLLVEGSNLTVFNASLSLNGTSWYPCNCLHLDPTGNSSLLECAMPPAPSSDYMVNATLNFTLATAVLDSVALQIADPRGELVSAPAFSIAYTQGLVLLWGNNITFMSPNLGLAGVVDVQLIDNNGLFYSRCSLGVQVINVSAVQCSMVWTSFSLRAPSALTPMLIFADKFSYTPANSSISVCNASSESVASACYVPPFASLSFDSSYPLWLVVSKNCSTLYCPATLLLENFPATSTFTALSGSMQCLGSDVVNETSVQTGSQFFRAQDPTPAEQCNLPPFSKGGFITTTISSKTAGISWFSIRDPRNGTHTIPPLVISPLQNKLGGTLTLSFPSIRNASVASLSLLEIAVNGSGASFPCDMLPPSSANNDELDFFIPWALTRGLSAPLNNPTGMGLSIQLYFLNGLVGVVPDVVVWLDAVPPLVNATQSVPVFYSMIGGQSFMIELPFPLPPWLTVTTHRAWVGLVPTTCSSTQAKTSLICVHPARTFSIARITVELGGAFNISSDAKSIQDADLRACEPSSNGSSPCLFSDPIYHFSVASDTPRQALPLQIANVGISILAGDVLAQLAAWNLTGLLFIDGSACGSFIAAGSMITCFEWPPTDLSSFGYSMFSSVTAPISLVAFNESHFVAGALPLFRYPIISAFIPSSAAPGETIVVGGSSFFLSSSEDNSVLSVTVGCVPCSKTVVVNPGILTCVIPFGISAAVSTYPLLKIHVASASTHLGTDASSLFSLGGQLTVSWRDAPLPIFLALPSINDKQLAAGLLLPNAPTVSLVSSGRAVCLLELSNGTVAGGGTSGGTMALWGSTIMSSSIATSTSLADITANISFSLVGSSGQAGQNALVSTLCFDSKGRVARSPPASLAAINVSLDWIFPSNASYGGAISWLPSLAVPLKAQFRFERPHSSDAAAAFDSYALPALASGVRNNVSCIFAFFPGANPSVVSPSLSLQSQLVSSYNMSVAFLSMASDGLSINATSQLTCARCPINSVVDAFVECTWLPTGQSFRAAASKILIPAVSSNLCTLPDTSRSFCAALVQDAYAPSLNGSIVLSISPFDANTICHLSWINASTNDANPSRDTLSSSYPVSAAQVSEPTKGEAAVAFWNATVTLEGPPDAILFLSASCLVFGDYAISSAPVPIIIAPYLVGIAVLSTSAPPTSPFVVSALPSPLVNATPVWPSGPLPTQLMPTQLPIVVLAHSQARLSCSLFVASFECSGAPDNLSGPYRNAVSLTVGGSSQTVMANGGDLTTPMAFASVGVLAAAGCTVQIAVNCSDGVGRSGSSLLLPKAVGALATPSSVSLFGLLTPPPPMAFGQVVSLSVVRLLGSWVSLNASEPVDPVRSPIASTALQRLDLGFFFPESPIPTLEAILFAALYTNSSANSPFEPAAVFPFRAALPSGAATRTAPGQRFRCSFAVVPFATNVPYGSLAQYISSLPASGSLSYDTQPLLLVNKSQAMFTVTSSALHTRGIRMGETCQVLGECIWEPSGDIVRFPARPLAVVAASINMTELRTPGRDYSQSELFDAAVMAGNASSILVLSYRPVEIDVDMSILPRAALSSTQVAQCSFFLLAEPGLLGASLSMVVDPSTISQLQSLRFGTNITAKIIVRGKARARFSLTIQCSVPGHVFVSSSLPMRLASFGAAIVAPTVPLSTFVPSDDASPWPLLRPGELQIALTGEVGGRILEDCSCSIYAATPAARVLPMSGSSVSDLSGVGIYGSKGLVLMPAFAISAPFAIGAVDLIITCSRALAPLERSDSFTWTVRINREPLVVICPNSSIPEVFSATELFPTVSVSVLGPDACSTSNQSLTYASPLLPLPFMSCLISVRAENSTSSATNRSSVILSGSSAVVDAATGIASFPSLALTAERDKSYTFILSCSSGRTVWPPLEGIVRNIFIRDCADGLISSGLYCIPCAQGEYSTNGVNSVCVKCPPGGAICENSRLSLLPNFYNAPSEANTTFDSETILYPCFNGESCTLSSQGTYGCAEGYEGPLCGVCAQGFTMYAGSQCIRCPTAAVSIFLVFFIVVAFVGCVVAATLRAAAPSSRQWAGLAAYWQLHGLPLSRVLLDYLQTIGILLTIGGTAPYRNAVGWALFFAESPLESPPLSCVAERAPFAARFSVVWLLPLLSGVVSLGVALCSSLLVHREAAEAQEGSSRSADLRLPSQTRQRCLLDRRLFERPAIIASCVLFILHTPITLASLRAIACGSPIGDVSYLTTDLTVACDSGQATMATFAFVSLASVSLAVPLALALGLACPAQGMFQRRHSNFVTSCVFVGYRYATALENATKPELPALPATIPGGDAAIAECSTERLGGAAADGKILPPPLSSSSNFAPQIRRASHHCDIFFSKWSCLSFATFGQTTAWWSAILLLRKVALATLATLVSSHYDQLFGANILFVGTFVAQFYSWPHEQAAHNTAESIAMSASALQAMMMLALLEIPDSPEQRSLPFGSLTRLQAAVTSASFVLNVAVLVSIIVAAAMGLCACSHETTDAAPSVTRQTHPKRFAPQQVSRFKYKARGHLRTTAASDGASSVTNTTIHPVAPAKQDDSPSHV